MHTNRLLKISHLIMLLAVLPAQCWAQDQVAGNLIQFNDNGAWSWFSEERAIVDQATGNLLIGSVTESNGAGGRDADVEIASFTFSNGSRNRFTLNSALGPLQGGNDHNSPVLTKLNDGRYVAAYATHGLDDLSRFRTSTNPEDITSWSPEVRVSNRPNNVTNSGSTTYSNIFQLSDDQVGGADRSGRLYNFHRSRGFDPNFSYSDDNGATWSYGGRVLNDTPSDPVTRNNVRPYTNYASNGTDEIHFINTENLPGFTPTGIYHTVIRGGKTYDSVGNVIDNNLYDTTAALPTSGTQIFAGTSGATGRGAWTSDIELDSAGNPYVAFSTQVGNNQNNLRYHYARFDGTSWTQNEIARGGTSLIPGQPDYSGNISLDPNDPNTVYISTDVNPMTGAALLSSADGQRHYEIYKGLTNNGGASFNWIPITQNSSVDNLRPIVPDWDANNTAVAWLRGTYGIAGTSATNTGQGYLDYDLAVVGVVEQAEIETSQIEYVDATSTNTLLADGRSLSLPTVTTSGNQGNADSKWHLRTGFGNGDSLLTAGERGNEMVDTLETKYLNGDETGEFDVFAYFWSNLSDQWEIRAGLSEDDLTWVRKQGAEQVDLSEFSTDNLLASDVGDLALYQVYIGRATVDAGDELSVFINKGFGSSSSTRTWYDGIGVARLAGLAGDFNGDGMVDAADYTVWRDGLGTTYTPDDYTIWANNYGATANSTTNSTTNSVPEPSAGLLLLTTALAAYRRR